MKDMLFLCKEEDVVEDPPMFIDIKGRPPLAVYQLSEEIYVTDRTCTHGDADLTEGFQDGEAIECPFHGGAFSIITGEPITLPCSKPLSTYFAIVQGMCISKGRSILRISRYHNSSEICRIPVFGVMRSIDGRFSAVLTKDFSYRRPAVRFRKLSKERTVSS